MKTIVYLLGFFVITSNPPKPVTTLEINCKSVDTNYFNYQNIDIPYKFNVDDNTDLPKTTVYKGDSVIGTIYGYFGNSTLKQVK